MSLSEQVDLKQSKMHSFPAVQCTVCGSALFQPAATEAAQSCYSEWSAIRDEGFAIICLLPTAFLWLGDMTLD